MEIPKEDLAISLEEKLRDEPTIPESPKSCIANAAPRSQVQEKPMSYQRAAEEIERILVKVVDELKGFNSDLYDAEKKTVSTHLTMQTKRIIDGERVNTSYGLLTREDKSLIYRSKDDGKVTWYGTCGTVTGDKMNNITPLLNNMSDAEKVIGLFDRDRLELSCTISLDWPSLGSIPESKTESIPEFILESKADSKSGPSVIKMTNSEN